MRRGALRATWALGASLLVVTGTRHRSRGQLGGGRRRRRAEGIRAGRRGEVSGNGTAGGGAQRSEQRRQAGHRDSLRDRVGRRAAGNGDGTFQPQKSYSSTLSTPGIGIAIDDFNGDGKPDIAVAFNSAGFGTFLGKGDGTLGSFQIDVGGDVQAMIASADLNHDGKKDVVMPIFTAGGVDVVLGKGDGTFQQPPPVYQSGLLPLGVAVADFDKNGTLDIATAGSGAVGILLGNGDGTFPFTGMSFPVASGSFIHSMAVGDFNGDGVLDVVAPDSNGVTVNVLLGKGDGTLLGAQPFGSVPDPYAVAVADLDMDGHADIVQTSDQSALNPGSIGVLLGRG